MWPLIEGDDGHALKVDVLSSDVSHQNRINRFGNRQMTAIKRTVTSANDDLMRRRILLTLIGRRVISFCLFRFW